MGNKGAGAVLLCDEGDDDEADTTHGGEKVGGGTVSREKSPSAILTCLRRPLLFFLMCIWASIYTMKQSGY